MSLWVLAIIGLNLIIGLGVVILHIRLSRAPKDDPRLSRGLQMLQSKISILEDLSDRTEMQVSQLTGLLQQKVLDVQKASHEAELQIERIKASVEKSQQVAQLFQDKIPHQEIIERQNAAKYMRASRMAQEGKTSEEIAEALSLPLAEIEFLMKFKPEILPELTGDPSLDQIP